ncbi:uncharacterized protein G2W53_009705 [Senna tora]|uniref:Uncharacterized protein n=1 Tax=Senna tora TaxID=362788 RepID=A0A834WYL5_9FABA|nr:uncharacterized protein G2W53_009705 [Senna tora]
MWIVDDFQRSRTIPEDTNSVGAVKSADHSETKKLIGP